MASQGNINWAIYNSLPPEQAQYQLAHIHESKMTSIIVTYAICLPILVLANIMRFVSRRIGRTKYGIDDWAMLLGLVILFSILFLLGLRASSFLSLVYSSNWGQTLALLDVVPALLGTRKTKTVLQNTSERLI